MQNQYSREDIINSFRWLGHAPYGYTELAAFHKNYKPGRENFNENRQKGWLPEIWYGRTEKQIMAFTLRFHKDHTCCYGINPRPGILKNKRKYVRSARDSDIKIVMNFYLDFDLTEDADEKKLLRLEEFLDEVDGYLGKEKINKPVRAFTGNGYHLLFPLPPTSVEEYPDISVRLKKFRDIVDYEFSDSMKSEAIKLDSTMDLRRVAKIYGTKKPLSNSRLSKFYGSLRIEDFVLKEYLLSLDISEPATTFQISVPDELPSNFKQLLESDKLIQQLWNNEGKTESADVSRSGYDFSLTKECIKKGITDIADLIAVLALRPEGAYRKSGKNEQYIRRTIGNAIFK